MKRRFRFNDLKRVSRRSAPTVSAYLAHAQREGEVERDPASQEYYLTPKGQDELDRIVTIERMRQHPVRFSGKVDSLIELNADKAAWIHEKVEANELPLPIQVDTTIYASEELAPMFERMKRDILLEEDVGPRTLFKKILKASTDSFVKQLIWSCIFERLAPPLSLSSILGFDLSFIVRFEGKKLAERLATPGDVRQELEAHRMGRRLAGALLLNLAFIGEGGRGILWEVFGPETYSSNYDLIPLLESGGLLEKEDADRLRPLVLDRYAPRGESAKKALLEIAFRYLKEGGILQIPRDATIESVVESIGIPRPVREPRKT